MLPFKKKGKFADGGFVNNEKHPAHQELKPNELEISEPIKTISELIESGDKRLRFEFTCDNYYCATIEGCDISIKILSDMGHIFHYESYPDIGLTRDEAGLLLASCEKRKLVEIKENRAKLVEIYCDSKDSN